MVTCRGSTRYWNYEDYWPSADELSAVNVIGTQKRNLINSVLARSITYSKSMDQPGRVANPARGQLNRENDFFPVRVRA